MATILMDGIKRHPELPQFTLDTLPLLKELKQRYLDAPAEVCIERARWITESMIESEGGSEPMMIRRARAVANYLERREPVFHNGNLVAGSTCSKEYGAPVYPEQLGLAIWPELESISTRKVNPQLLSDADAATLNFDIFPYWMDRTILEVTRKRLTAEQSPTLRALKVMERLAFFTAGKAATISHTVPCFEVVLQKGLRVMMDEARTSEREVADGTPDARQKRDFYRAAQIAMQGMIDYARRLKIRAEQMAAEHSGAEGAHWAAMAEVLARVPGEPATTFREAVNCVWLCHVAALAENVNMAMSPGRLDQILFPYYRHDVEAGTLTVEDSLNLIGCLWFKIADNTNLVPESAERMFGGAGTVPAVTLGGVDADGKDAVNDLTYLMLRVTELLSLKDPNVNARYHSGVNEPGYRDRVAQVIINTRAIPAFYNDEVNIDTLVNQGVTLEHARDYAVVGCVELTSAGREYTSSSSILMNLSAAIDMAFYSGRRPYLTGDWQIGPKTPEPEALATFEDFQTAFEAQLKALIDMAVDLNNELGISHQQYLPTPLLSCLFRGPLEKGQDLIFGGALYNSSGSTHVAFADVCDSLNGIEQAVYRDKRVTLRELRDRLEDDFDSDPELLAYLRNRAAKFGTDDSLEASPVAVKNSQRLIRFLYDAYHSRTNYRGGRYRPAYWTMTNHAGYGTMGQALPSGRRAHEVFSSGITPASQSAKDLTGAYKSVGELGSRWIPGGVALNMKYTPEPGMQQSSDYLQEFISYLEGYFASGGMQVQFNVQSYEDLIEATKDPERYRELIVRVSGYSAYFKDLNPAMQHELVTRTQYGLGDGRAVPLAATPTGGGS